YVTTNDSLTYEFLGLMDDSTYYVRGTGKTQNGIEIDTDYIYIRVNYVNPSFFSHLILENVPNSGSIKIGSYLITSEGETITDVKYIQDEYVDLRNNTVVFKDDFTFPDNWTIGERLCDIKKNVPLMIISDKNKDITLYYRERYIHENGLLKGFFELKTESPLSCNAVHNTDFIDPITPYDLYTIWIQYKNDTFDFRAIYIRTLESLD
ncbi:MAG: hypothetical protein Q4P84_00320, partial [Elusimicrobiales bacterium]|nr:hypothetical protein [Elusimicrobiales bacterium]